MLARLTISAVMAVCLLVQADRPDAHASAENVMPARHLVDFWQEAERPVELFLCAAAVYTLDCDSMRRVPLLLSLGDDLESWDREHQWEDDRSEQASPFVGCGGNVPLLCLYDRIVRCAINDDGLSSDMLAAALENRFCDGANAEYLDDLLLRESLSHQELPRFLVNPVVREWVQSSLNRESEYAADADSRTRIIALKDRISGESKH
jgi:hypothetical protein